MNKQKIVITDFVQNSLLKPSDSSNSTIGMKAVVQIIQNQFKNNNTFADVARSFDNAVEETKKKSNRKQATDNAPGGQGSSTSNSNANL